MKKAKTSIPRHQWTHDGTEVLIVKCVGTNGITYGGFRWPLEVGAVVKAPDWNPRPVCGGGLHGWPWGLAIGDGMAPEWMGVWLVFGALPTDVAGGSGELKGKCKARCGVVRHVGAWHSAMAYVLSGQLAWVAQAASSATGDYGASSATGDCGASSATGLCGASSATGSHGASNATGECGASSATGRYGASSATGRYGASSATGLCGASSATGRCGASSATGDCGASSATGDCGAAMVTGLSGKAQAGRGGCIALAWLNPHTKQPEMRCRETGTRRGQLRPGTWYALNTKGVFVRVKP